MINKLHDRLVHTNSPFAKVAINGIIMYIGSIITILGDIVWVIGDLMTNPHWYHWVVGSLLVIGLILVTVSGWFLYKGIDQYLNKLNNKENNHG